MMIGDGKLLYHHNDSDVQQAKHLDWQAFTSAYTFNPAQTLPHSGIIPSFMSLGVAGSFICKVLPERVIEA
jgi:hypothetical protein